MGRETRSVLLAAVRLLERWPSVRVARPGPHGVQVRRLGARAPPGRPALGRSHLCDGLGVPARAAALFGEVLSADALSRRDAGFFLVRYAAALALSGEPDNAAAVGLQAVQLAREANSERTLRVVADVVQTLAPWRSRPGPRALREAVSAGRP